MNQLGHYKKFYNYSYKNIVLFNYLNFLTFHSEILASNDFNKNKI